MIKYITRKELDVAKYNDCIKTSLQSEIFAFSWYLDIVAENWDVLVLDDYKAVMPIPWKKKYLIKYVYPPFWILQLGIFSTIDKLDESKFITALEKQFKFIELRFNTKNSVTNSDSKKYHKIMTTTSYEDVETGYRKDRKKDIRKAQENGLLEVWDDNLENLIKLFKNNVGKRTPEIKEEDYQNLKYLMQASIEKGVGQVLSVYDNENVLVASGFFLLHNKTVTILCSSTDFNNRKNGANTFLIDRAIYKYLENYDVFYFGGSSIASVANYFMSFGAKELRYQLYLKKPRFF